MSVQILLLEKHLLEVVCDKRKGVVLIVTCGGVVIVEAVPSKIYAAYGNNLGVQFSFSAHNCIMYGKGNYREKILNP